MRKARQLMMASSTLSFGWMKVGDNRNQEPGKAMTFLIFLRNAEA
jgi:hypothetical protein